MLHNFIASKLFADVEIWIFSIWPRKNQIEIFLLHFLTIPLNKKGIINHPYYAPVELELSSWKIFCQNFIILLLCRDVL